MVILDDDQKVCPPGDKVTDHLSEAKTIFFDYKDHVVLQFTQLEKQGDTIVPVFTFKFVPYDVACKAKTKLKDALKGMVKEEDVMSAEFKANLDDKTLKKFASHLKFVWKSAQLGSRFACNFIEKGSACMNATVRVLMDAFEENHRHYVITMEDNWVSKEFMSASFDSAYY